MCIKALSINQKIMRCTDLETASRIFQEEFGKILENHAPVKVLQTRNHYLPYLSDETKLLMEERNALKEEATKLSDDQLFNEDKRKRTEVKARLEKEEIEFHKNKLHDANLTIKKVWKTVYDILGQVDNKAPTKIMDDDKIITSPKALANVFNKMFQDKVRKLRTQTRNAPKVNPIDRLKAWLDKKENAAPEFSLKTIDMVKLRTILKKLKPSHSHGMDFIDANSINIAAPLIEDSILHIVNLSISTGEFASPCTRRTTRRMATTIGLSLTL
jgi:hypothetical protein